MSLMKGKKGLIMEWLTKDLLPGEFLKNLRGGAELAFTYLGDV